MVPIKGDLTVKFYFDRFYILIKEVIDEVIRKIDPDSPGCAKNCYNLVKAFIKKVLKISKEFVAKSWEPLGAIDFFSKILNRKIENLDDYIEIDRIMCDFYNMVCCVSGIRDNLEDSELDFINPMLANNHEFRVSKGFEITSKSPYKLKEIKAYNSESYIFFLERDVDYFEKDLMNGFSARFSPEKLKEEKIHLIEVVTTEKKFHFHLNKFTMV
ncbi:hypothetical protein NBO_12g0012 [Nosema bombycis CQ1]|uniref:Uncharacterized protein n=1 Tax=Nosema bombycis (strain CQ1 / CVCC 102059) TaxID=578461 RepID=R0KVL7_NOSB1|nr:hypothetical protein NBO_12g0012 [Nosema bombycis CQ1]|eukprot:EOB14906.1 hypothetical protein NBO_12g0012 [Nosema bombycis CQ1]